MSDEMWRMKSEKAGAKSEVILQDGGEKAHFRHFFLLMSNNFCTFVAK